jgi:hypothetical protein
MSCQRFREAISDHACGAPLGDAAAAHLGSCTRCRGAFDEEQRLISQVDLDLRRALAITASDSFAQRVSVRAHGAPVNAGAGTVSTRWWLGAAAAAVIVVGVYFASPAHDRGAPQQAATPSASTPEQVPSARVDTPSAATLPTLAPTRAKKRPAGSSRQSIGVAGARARTEPEVVVSATQARAIARMKELVRNGVLSGAPLEISVPPDELVIAPLTVPELVLPDAELGKGPGTGSTQDRQ